jgi:RNA polymerase sigma-70 factor (ECF subfamily)
MLRVNMVEDQVERFERQVLPYLDDAYTLARYLLRDEHDAQDAVQDAALKAFRHFAGFRQGDVRAWLLTIVRNSCYDWFKSHRLDRASVPWTDDAAQGIEDPASADDMTMQGSERDRVRAAVDALPPDLREIIVMRELNDLSYREISEVIGMPIGTVMSRLSRARDRLAAALGDSSRRAG